MHLVYFDESGNTGNNLNDEAQPIFVLGALIVPEDRWQAVEVDLLAALKSHFPEIHESGEELHATDLRNGSNRFRGVTPAARLALRDAWLGVAGSHGLRFVYRSIIKKRYQEAIRKLMGPGIQVNPHIAAFPMVAMVVNEWLSQRSALGMFISDENKEIVRDVERSIHSLRQIDDLHLSQIIEKGFFIDSSKSRLLQLCDLCTLQARKKEERAAGAKPKSIDDDGILGIESLIHRGNERFRDVIAWMKREWAS